MAKAQHYRQLRTGGRLYYNIFGLEKKSRQDAIESANRARASGYREVHVRSIKRNGKTYYRVYYLPKSG